jgi:two-component system sensor histidine kinase QseC
LQPVALGARAKDAMAANEPDAQRKGMSIALVDEADTEVMAEPILMNIMLDNVIDNAIKYGNAGGRVEVAVRRDAHAITLTVGDDGPGVAPEDITRLTDRFFRVTGNGASGTGLGLSIVARIADYFGAKLDPYALDPYALDPYALDPYALDPYALDPYALDPYALD